MSTYRQASLNNLAELLRPTNPRAEAEPLFKRALAITEDAFGADHPSTRTAAANLSTCIAKLKARGKD